MNLFEPWILLRLLLGCAALAAALLAAPPAYTTLRRFDATRASEGQLLIERRFELSATLGKLVTVLAVAGLFVSLVAGGQLFPSIRGAMCAYGLFSVGPGGFRMLGVDIGFAVVAGVLRQVHAADDAQPRLTLVKPLAWGSLLLVPMAAWSLVENARFWLGLDRSVVATCCSIELDRELSIVAASEVGSPWPVASVAGVLAVVAAVLALLAALRPDRARLTAAAATSLAALPLALLAVSLAVAPHVFETPTHRCPFCLFRADAGYLGYAFAAAVFLASTRVLGAAASAWMLPPAAHDLTDRRLRRSLFGAAAAWTFALVLAVAPIARYLFLYDGRSLFL